MDGGGALLPRAAAACCCSVPVVELSGERPATRRTFGAERGREGELSAQATQTTQCGRT